MNKQLAEGMIVAEFNDNNFYIFSDKGKGEHTLEVKMGYEWFYMPMLGTVKKSDYPELYKVLNDTGEVTDEKLKSRIEKQLL